MIDRKAVEEIFRGVKVCIGLRQQGHMPTVERMRADGATWDEIGKAIGWDGKAAEEWYEMETEEGRDLREKVGRFDGEA